MLTALLRALTQLLTDPRLWRLVVFSLFLSLLAFLALWGFLAGLIHWLHLRQWVEWGGWIASFVAALLLFPTTFVLVQSLFQEAVAARVERKYHPQLPPPVSAPRRIVVWRALKFTCLMIVLNLLAAPVYLWLMVIAGSGAIVFVLVNGFLCGREYFEVIALRRIPIRDVDTVRRAHGWTVFGTGLLISLLGMIPFLNLLVPILGTAAMVHVFHRRKA